MKRSVVCIITVLIVTTFLLLAGGKSSSTKNGTWHRVKPKQTLYSISREYGVAIQEIAEVNNITDIGHINAGTMLLIPRGTTTALQGSAKIMEWPIKGKVTSGYGYGSHANGIDIAASKNTGIKAAANGKVTFIGKMRGYGTVIIISHGKGITTVYAPVSTCLIKEGRMVKAGSIIGKLGKLAHEDKCFLHFRVKKDGKYVNPLLYLK